MKKIYITIILLLCGFQVSFSQVVLEKGKYYSSPELKHFEGTWVGTTASDSLVIKLELEKVYAEVTGVYLDQLKGNYFYSKNGKIIVNNLGADNFTITNGSKLKEEPGAVLRFFFEMLYMTSAEF